jgi:serine/threonine protein kinase
MPSDPQTLAGSPLKETVPNRRIHNFQVQPQTVIGRGAYSTVYLARDLKTGDLVAAKSMDLRRYLREFESEVSVMSTLSHEGLIGYRGSEVLDSVGLIYMDYMPFPTLFDHISRSGSLPERDSLNIFCNLVEALHAMHKQGVAHKDLKPENLFIDPETLRIKMIDFGLSVVVSEGELVDQYYGSPMYMAPEVLNRDPHNPLLSDVWSLGVILYQMLIGDSPWSGAESLDDLFDLVVFEPVVPIPASISPPLRALIGGMLSHDPTKRPSIFQIKQTLVDLGPLYSLV